MMSRLLVKQRELFEWLHSLDLTHHFEPFIQNGYEDLRICAEMGESDLEIIGVRDIHEKIELLQAIRHLRLSHFGKDSFSGHHQSQQYQKRSDGGRPTPPNYLEYQTHFQNGDEIKYCLQKRYFPSIVSNCTNSSQAEDSSAANSDYQDIDDCDCGPFFQDQYYDPLSPQRHQQRELLASVGSTSGNGNTRTPLRKFQQQQHYHQQGPGPSEEACNGIHLTKTPLRDHHPIRRVLPESLEPSRPFGGTNELTQETIGSGCLRSAHLYGSHALPATSSTLRKVESEDLDSSSGIEPDLVSRKCYDPRNPNPLTTGSTSSTTPEEGQEQYWWGGSGSKEVLKSGGGSGWYRGPPTCSSLVKKDGSKKSSRNVPNCGGLDVLQLQTGGHHNQLRTKRHLSGSSPKSGSTLSRRPRGVTGVTGLNRSDRTEGVSVVPTVSGLLSSIELNQFYCPDEHQVRVTPKKGVNMASNINCREFDYEECGLSNTYEEISSRGSSSYRTPTHFPKSHPHHQYLEHVIISSANGSGQSALNLPLGYGNDVNCAITGAVTTTPSPTKNRQVYTPGIYSPSSCLMDRDDIYDYAPPIQRNRHYQSSPAKMYSPFRSKGKSKSKSSLSCMSGMGSEGSPLQLEAEAKGNRGGGPLTPLHRSASLVTSHSTPTYVNVTDGRKGTGGNGPKVLSFPSSPSSQSSNGCRTLANLSKLSRRLGLGRLFRTLRIQGSSDGSRKGPVLTKPRLQQRINQKSASVQHGLGAEPHLEISSHINDCTANTTMSTLPSNERIIETINRLKYEELQKRKERIAQEHQLEQGEGSTLKAPASPKLSPEQNGSSPRSSSRFSNPMKGHKKTKSQTEDGGNSGGLEEDSIEALGDDYVLPLPSTSNGGSGVSPSKSLLSKVKELGARNHKKLRRFSFSSKSSQSDHIHGGEAGTRRGSDLDVSPTKRPSAAIDIVLGGKMGDRNSSDEDYSLSSLNQRSLSICDIEEYNGPFVGEAFALVDCISSPYDLHALSYKKGDVLQIIEKKPTGSWKGKLKYSNKVGYFKFINVQMLPNPEETENGEGEYGTPVPHPSSSLDSATFPYSTSNGSGTQSRRRTKATSPLTPLQVETRQVVANVINGIRKENAALFRYNSRRELGDESTGPGEDLDQITDASQDPGTFQAHSGVSEKRSKSGRRRSSSSSLKKERPRSVGHLLKKINLEEHIPLFILHGFESLDLFKELEEEDLDRLAITELADRVKIMTAVELLRDYDATEEIPPIIIPTYSCPSPTQLLQGEDEDPLNQILEPPPNFTRGSGTTTGTAAAVRDSGVFLKCDDKEEEDPEVEEIILSPSNLPMCNLNPADKFLLTNLRQKSSNNTKQGKPTVQQLENDSNMAQFSSLEEHYGEVRQRFLHAKSLFESSGNSVGNGGQASTASNVKPLSSEYKNQFLYCEKSSDSGISLGANSPPPNNNTYE